MADLTEYKPRQATESWLDFLKRQGPEVVNGVAMALAGLRPGMMMRGPSAGVLNPRDFAIAEQLNGAPGRTVGAPWDTAGAMGEHAGVRDASTGGQLRNFSRAPEPDPYLSAVMQQRFGQKAGNVNAPPEPGSVEAWRMARMRDGAFKWPGSE